jgi:osmotically-inducible protein OsmY
MTDKDLKGLVDVALEGASGVDTADIGVSVDKGVVTLRGTVASYIEKVRAERAVLGVHGVKALANDLVVHLKRALERTDTEIAQAAVAALKWNTTLPDDRVTVTVDDGWIALAGTVDWQHQTEAATRALRDLTGVKGVSNNIVLESEAKAAEIREQIEAAFKRAAEFDSRRVAVTAHDGRVTLNGNVHSCAERQAAERVAWAAPGVEQVDDCLTVEP